ncbi:unnamed protein product [Darwinula stevensoni]|uniref:CARD domain-containing protein n=1 Tax=Darwinula stevensoni TaxID=69355 RepID=A0A7R9AF30_9CRUS|nr:unnamed protein product [Darwinula stevensoni]CAG0902898.1 unnamed protein product [Darwinula stevensoni]
MMQSCTHHDATITSLDKQRQVSFACSHCIMLRRKKLAVISRPELKIIDPVPHICDEDENPSFDSVTVRRLIEARHPPLLPLRDLLVSSHVTEATMRAFKTLERLSDIRFQMIDQLEGQKDGPSSAEEFCKQIFNRKRGAVPNPTSHKECGECLPGFYAEPVHGGVLETCDKEPDRTSTLQKSTSFPQNGTSEWDGAVPLGPGKEECIIITSEKKKSMVSWTPQIAIANNWKMLIENMDVEAVENYLIEKRLLDMCKREELNDVKVKERREALLQLVRKRDFNFFHGFLHGLQAAQQGHLAETLVKEWKRVVEPVFDSNFFLLPKLTSALKGARFEDKSIRNNVARAFNELRLRTMYRELGGALD